MNDLKQLFGSYNICARFAPGFLFVVSMYFLCGYNINLLNDIGIIFIVLLSIISGACGFVSAAIIKIIECLLWKLINPTILYLKIWERGLYKVLYNKFRSNKKIMGYLLKITRNDNKLFWKNVSYGFFRNSILLSLFCLYVSYSTEYFYINVVACIFGIFMTFVCAFYYAHQIIESYQEKISFNGVDC